MGKVWLVVGVLVICAVAAVESAPASSPAADCSTLILDMVDCLSFVSNGSTESKPKGNCCSGLKTVLKTNAECLCETFKNSAQYGIPLNMTKALTLPSACGVSTPPISNCGLSPGAAPGAAPANSPALSPKSAKTPAAAPSPSPSPSDATSGGITGQAPAPAPSGASSVSIPFVLLFSAAIASSSFF